MRRKFVGTGPTQRSLRSDTLSKQCGLLLRMIVCPCEPLASLETRLRCPRCGSRRVVVIFDVPKQPITRVDAAE